MNLVVPFGFYGSGNIGDEATLAGFARLLGHSDQRMRVAVASRNPGHTARVEPAFTYFRPSGTDPRRWWAKMRASACVFAGGTPIMDGLGNWPLSEVVPQVHAMAERGCPVGFVGIGAENLERDESRQIVAEQIAPFARQWSVRSERDRQRLIEYGVAAGQVTVAADMAWLIERSSDEFGRQRMKSWSIDRSRYVVAVNLVNENLLFEKHPELTSALAAALDELVESRNARVLLLSNEVRSDSSFDAAAARVVTAKMKHADAALVAPVEYLSPREMMSIISCCNLAISMRYHFCLFAAVQGVPFVGLTRSDKISDLCWDLGWQAAIRPCDLTAADLLEHVSRAEIDIEHLPARVAEMRVKALQNLSCLSSLCSTQPSRQPLLVS